MVRAYVERCKEVNPIINGIIEDRYQEAIEDAMRADELVNKLTEADLEDKYPLLGVPCTIKEQLKVKGIINKLKLYLGSTDKKQTQKPAVGGLQSVFFSFFNSFELE